MKFNDENEEEDISIIHDIQESLQIEALQLFNLQEIIDLKDISLSLNLIRKVYHKLAKEHHPDKGGDSEKFKEINDAYQLLTNKEHLDSTVREFIEKFNAEEYKSKEEYKTNAHDDNRKEMKVSFGDGDGDGGDSSSSNNDDASYESDTSFLNFESSRPLGHEYELPDFDNNLDILHEVIYYRKEIKKYLYFLQSNQEVILQEILSKKEIEENKIFFNLLPFLCIECENILPADGVDKYKGFYNTIYLLIYNNIYEVLYCLFEKMLSYHDFIRNIRLRILLKRKHCEEDFILFQYGLEYLKKFLLDCLQTDLPNLNLRKLMDIYTQLKKMNMYINKKRISKKNFIYAVALLENIFLHFFEGSIKNIPYSENKIQNELAKTKLFLSFQRSW